MSERAERGGTGVRKRAADGREADRGVRRALPRGGPERRRRPAEERSARPGLGRQHDGVTGEPSRGRSEEHTSELQSRQYLVCRLLLEKKYVSSRARVLFVTRSAVPN